MVLREYGQERSIIPGFGTVKLRDIIVQPGEKDQLLWSTARSRHALVPLPRPPASLGQLTAGIAHEIKNPLNFVNDFAALHGP